MQNFSPDGRKVLFAVLAEPGSGQRPATRLSTLAVALIFYGFTSKNDPRRKFNYAKASDCWPGVRNGVRLRGVAAGGGSVTPVDDPLTSDEKGDCLAYNTNLASPRLPGHAISAGPARWLRVQYNPTWVNTVSLGHCWPALALLQAFLLALLRYANRDIAAPAKNALHGQGSRLL